MNSQSISVKSMTIRLAGVMAASVLMLSLASVAPLPFHSPFLGQWETKDADGNSSHLTIGGRDSGPLWITWMDETLPACGGGSGILHGTSLPQPWDADLIAADMRTECLAGQPASPSRVTLSFRSSQGGLKVTDAGGTVVTWKRPRIPPEAPPTLTLRVDYGDDWVESFYEAGHKVWVIVTEPNGITPKGYVEAVTEPKDYWNGQPGFQSLDSVWRDVQGNRMDKPPDIRVNDWVFAWADNGASREVQIHEIRGSINLDRDSIEGTVLVPGSNDPVEVECLDWGSQREEPYSNRAGGYIVPNGRDPYSCSWSGAWNVQAGQMIGVGYHGADGDWVAHGFRTGFFTVFPEQDVLEVQDWPEHATLIARVAGKPQCKAASSEGNTADKPDASSDWLEFPEDCDLTPGDVLTVSDGATSLTHTVRKLAITRVDVGADMVSGTAEPGAMIYAWVHEYYEQTRLQLRAEHGTWRADFRAAGFDVIDGMCGRSEIVDETGLRTAADWCASRP